MKERGVVACPLDVPAARARATVVDELTASIGHATRAPHPRWCSQRSEQQFASGRSV